MIRRTHRAALPLLLACSVSAGVVLGVSPAAAVQAAQPSLVNAKPAAYTPNVNDGVVYAIGQVGSTVFLGGAFTSVSPHGSSTTYPVTDIVAFTAGTGALVTSFAPTLNGQVNTIIAGPTSGTVYVGGSFTTVDGVKSRVALLDATTGALAAGWTSPAVDGQVNKLVLADNQLFVGGEFTGLGGAARAGLATVNPTTGALTKYSTLSFTGHHNYGVTCDPAHTTCAKAGTGIKSMDVNPAGTQLVAIGNFTSVSGAPRDQIAVLDLGPTAAALDPGWSSAAYTAGCAYWAFDSYIRDVQFAPDGSYFVVVATGGGFGSRNTDGTLGLCDSAARFDSGATGSDVQPTWVDYTGNDSFWTVAVTGTAIYVGGHQRWLNNSHASDSAGSGSVPRPGLAAMDPVNGMPLAWNPGRNPRGKGAYALLATPDGLYVGSDTDWIGNHYYHHDKVAFFPLAGGKTLAPTTTGSFPGNVYLLGSNRGTGSSVVRYVHWDGSASPGGVSTASGLDATTVKGAFAVNGTVYYGTRDGSFYAAPFDGHTFGAPVAIDPYDDPTWSTVKTGSGSGTYRGVKSAFYGEIPSMTSMFYSGGRVYYTLTGKPAMYWRWFEPDSGVVGSDEFTTTDGLDWSHVAGAFLVGSTLYFADAGSHNLLSVPFAGGQPAGSPVVTDSSMDWTSSGAFVVSRSTVNDQPPVASFATACSTGATTCTVDAGASSDPDGRIEGYRWDWGDGSSSQDTVPTDSHTYAAAGKYTVTLTVSDNDAVTTSVSHQVRAGIPDPLPITFQGGSSYDGSAATGTVTAPAATGAGDDLLLFASWASTSVTATTPAGWTLVGTTSKNNLSTAVYQKVAQQQDAGAAVTVTFSSAVKASLSLAGYANAAPTVEAAASTTQTSTASHVSPTLTGLSDGSLAVTFWTDKSTGTTSWSLPTGVTSRSVGYGSGAGAVSGALADSGSGVTGSYGGLTATTNTTSGAAAAWTLALGQAS